MNVITLVSCNAGAGKSTLAAHLAVAALAAGHRCLLIDAAAQGPLATWHARRLHDAPVVRSAERGIKQAVAAARLEGFDWVLIDTPASRWHAVSDAIEAATLVVIPARASRFDLAAAYDTMKVVRAYNKPYAAVINAAPAKRDDREPIAVASARAQLEKLHIPVWAGQITQRTGLAIALATGATVLETAPDSPAADEIAGLWWALSRSVAAVHRAGPHAMADHDGDMPAQAA